VWAYRWDWKWEAKYFVFYDPDAEIPAKEAELVDKVRDEVTRELIERFLDRGHPLEVVSVDTDVSWVCVAEPEPPWELNYYYKAVGTTRTKFRTDIPHSPISPEIVLIVKYVAAAVITFLIGYFGLQTAKTIFSRPEPIEEFCCPICGECFPTAGALDAHMREAHGITQFTCPYCGATFSTSEELYHHIESVHGVVRIPWGLIALLVGAGLIYLFYKEWKR